MLSAFAESSDGYRLDCEHPIAEGDPDYPVLLLLDFIVEDGFSYFMHLLDHEVEVVDGGEGEAGKLLGFEEVVQVGDVVVLAGVAVACWLDGTEVGSIFTLGDVELAIFRESDAVAGKLCGVGAIEGVKAEGD